MALFSNAPDDENADDPTFEQVAAMADRLGIQGEQRANYIHDHMTQLGYEHVQSRESYRRPAEEGAPPESAGNRWGFGGGQKQQQQQGQRPPVGGQRQSQRPSQGASDDGF